MSESLTTHTIDLRVRYNETDAMGLLHHSNYVTYFELGRTELFRAQGGSYQRMEELGMFFVVASLTVKYRKPAKYDEVLTLTTEISRQSPAKLEHHYVLRRGEDVLAEADSVIACVDKHGQVQPIPDNLVEKTRL